MNYMPARRSDGTIQSQRVMQPWPKDRPFRILSIDCGGICGILPASILAELEHRFLGGASIARHFDLIAGTSTGGLIALGLGAGMTATQVKQFYVDRGTNIFPSRTGLVGAATGFLRRKKQIATTVYDEKALERELLRIFQDRTFGESNATLKPTAANGSGGMQSAERCAPSP